MYFFLKVLSKTFYMHINICNTLYILDVPFSPVYSDPDYMYANVSHRQICKNVVLPSLISGHLTKYNMYLYV